MTLRGRLKLWAADVKRDTYALYLGARDPRVPWAAKLLAIVVAAYAVSPYRPYSRFYSGFWDMWMTSSSSRWASLSLSV